MATIEKGRKLMTLKDNPKARPHMQAAAALASFEPIICPVVDSITADK